MATMWKRGEVIAEGRYSTVSFATPKLRSSCRWSFYPPLMAVKWARISDSAILQKEGDILSKLQGCPSILRCYEYGFTTDDGKDNYNVLLEYASGGTLATLIENSNGGLPESDVRLYTRSILQGLCHIHDRGYVHCNMRPQNILLVPCSSTDLISSSNEYVAKIADFGSAKNSIQEKKREKECGHLLRGSILYASPECVLHREQEAPSDIWALGCVVVEMMTGEPAWRYKDFDDLVSRIGYGMELPETPSGMSKEGKDFLKRCFVRTAEFRWTADMLLQHPFVEEDDEAKKVVKAPKGVQDKVWSYEDIGTDVGRKRRNRGSCSCLVCK